MHDKEQPAEQDERWFIQRCFDAGIQPNDAMIENFIEKVAIRIADLNETEATARAAVYNEIMRRPHENNQ